MTELWSSRVIIFASLGTPLSITSISVSKEILINTINFISANICFLVFVLCKIEGFAFRCLDEACILASRSKLWCVECWIGNTAATCQLDYWTHLTFHFSLPTFHHFTISLPSPANKIFNFHCLFLLQFGKLVNGNKCWPFSFIVVFLLSTDALVFGCGSGWCNDARYPNKSWGYPRKFLRVSTAGQIA